MQSSISWSSDGLHPRLLHLVNTYVATNVKSTYIRKDSVYTKKVHSYGVRLYGVRLYECVHTELVYTKCVHTKCVYTGLFRSALIRSALIRSALIRSASILSAFIWEYGWDPGTWGSRGVMPSRLYDILQIVIRCYRNDGVGTGVNKLGVSDTCDCEKYLCATPKETTRTQNSRPSWSFPRSIHCWDH
jgi:hypothetical protein